MLLRLLLCFLVLPSLAQATVFWDDEMESGNSGYDPNTGVAGAMAWDTSVFYSGTGSIRYNYPASCYPDSSAQTFCGGSTNRGFAPTDVLYTRMMLRISNPFTVSDVFTKIFRTDINGVQVGNWWTMGCCGSTKLEVHNQNIPDGAGGRYTQVNYTSYLVPAAQWVCLETFQQLNTPGSANGIQQAWADGVQILNSSNILWRAAGDAGQFYNVQLYRQTGFGNIWVDRMAAGNTRIGCPGTVLPTDTTPPAVPTGFTTTASAGGSVSLAWVNPTAADLASIVIRRCQGSCTPTVVLTTVTAPTNTGYVDASVAANTQYSYNISAVDTSGNASAVTTTSTITTGTVFRTTLQTDNWARADNTDLGASYTAGYTGMTNGKILSQRMLPTTLGTDTVEEYTGVTTPNDQWCSVTIGTLTGANQASVGCFLRMTAPATYSNYRCAAQNAVAVNKATLRRFDAGAINTLASDTTAVWQTGDVMLCQMVGTALKLYQIRSGVETLLLSVTDATYASGVTGVYASASVGGALTDSQSSMFAMGGFSSSSTSAVAVDSTSTSATTNLTNTISWTHTVGTGSNRLLKVCAYARDEASAGTPIVTSITANGLPLTKVRADLFSSAEPVWINTELWYLVNPGSGSQTITITWAGSPNRYGVGASTSYTGILQTSPLDASAGATGTSVSVSTPITTVTDHDLVTDCAIGRADPLTIGAGQTTDTNFNTTVFVDAMGASSVLDKTPAGSETMDWTQSVSSSYAITAVAFKPASVTPVVAPTIASLVLSTSGATLTYGATTPTTIRVVIGSNSSPITQTTVEPIASFPGGVYTKTWPDGYDFVCFYPRDALGVENTDSAANKCGSLTGIVAALDTTPIVMTQALPGGTLNQGTTSTTIAASLNKPGACRYAATNIAYDSMTLTLTPANLIRSATVSGLTNGTTTHYYVQCRFTNAIGTDITTSTALDIAVTVANSAPSDTTAPSTVTNLVGTPLSQSQEQLVWTAATDNVAVQGYQVYQDLTGTCSNFSAVGVPVTTTTTIANLPPSTPVSFVVRAIDTSQNLSAADSNCVTVTTAPLADTVPPSTMTNFLSLQVLTQSVTLSWDPGSDNSGLFAPVIEYCVGAGCSTFTVYPRPILGDKVVVGLLPSTTYRFRGRFVDAAGNPSTAYSAIITVTTGSSGLLEPRFGPVLSRPSGTTTRPTTPSRPLR